MRSCLTQAENTLLLLFPAPETFEIHNSIGDVRSKLDSSDQTSDNLLREGIGKTDQTNSSKEVTSSNSINPSNKLPAAKTRHKTECASASEVISNADETSCETVSTHTNDVCLDGMKSTAISSVNCQARSLWLTKWSFDQMRNQL